MVLSTVAVEMQKSKKETAKTMHTTVSPVSAQVDTGKAQVPSSVYPPMLRPSRCAENIASREI